MTVSWNYWSSPNFVRDMSAPEIQ